MNGPYRFQRDACLTNSCTPFPLKNTTSCTLQSYLIMKIRKKIVILATIGSTKKMNRLAEMGSDLTH